MGREDRRFRRLCHAHRHAGVRPPVSNGRPRLSHQALHYRTPRQPVDSREGPATSDRPPLPSPSRHRSTLGRATSQSGRRGRRKAALLRLHRNFRQALSTSQKPQIRPERTRCAESRCAARLWRSADYNHHKAANRGAHGPAVRTKQKRRPPYLRRPPPGRQLRGDPIGSRNQPPKRT